jgi:hypothetical protein
VAKPCAQGIEHDTPRSYHLCGNRAGRARENWRGGVAYRHSEAHSTGVRRVWRHSRRRKASGAMDI